MKIPRKQQSGRLERKKSLFFSYLFPIETKEHMDRHLETLQKEHPKADHIVYAYRIGREPHTTSGYSDAGEPRGTAGKPLFDLIGYKELTNVLIAVVRYFGGIKLGTGGLVKAYTESGQVALEKAPVEELHNTKTITVKTDYHFYEPVKRYLQQHEITVKGEEFTTEVLLACSVIEEEAEQVGQELSELTNGTVIIE